MDDLGSVTGIPYYQVPWVDDCDRGRERSIHLMARTYSVAHRKLDVARALRVRFVAHPALGIIPSITVQANSLVLLRG